jgi:hypothetical protein
MQFRQVWVIQCKSDGLFLTPALHFARSLSLAGRCFDVQSAMDTAEANLPVGDYIISSFWEPEQ